jgi:hypothetical protein
MLDDFEGYFVFSFKTEFGSRIHLRQPVDTVQERVRLNSSHLAFGSRTGVRYDSALKKKLLATQDERPRSDNEELRPVSVFVQADGSVAVKVAKQESPEQMIGNCRRPKETQRLPLRDSMLLQIGDHANTSRSESDIRSVNALFAELFDRSLALKLRTDVLQDSNVFLVDPNLDRLFQDAAVCGNESKAVSFGPGVDGREEPIVAGQEMLRLMPRQFASAKEIPDVVGDSANGLGDFDVWHSLTVEPQDFGGDWQRDPKHLSSPSLVGHPLTREHCSPMRNDSYVSRHQKTKEN